jgi:uncharacterized membrane protein
MKRVLTLTFLLLLGFVFLQSNVNSPEEAAAAKPKFKYSKKVNAVIQEKCYGCHSEQGRSDKAKEKLMWDNVPGMDADGQAHILEEILEVVEEGSMPPSRFLENNPDKKLTDDEKALMEKWAGKMHKKISK